MGKRCLGSYRLEWRIGVGQAFTLVTVPGMTGERMGLSEEEIDEIRGWVRKKRKVAKVAIAQGLTEARTRHLAELVAQAESEEKLQQLLAQGWRVPIHAREEKWPPAPDQPLLIAKPELGFTKAQLLNRVWQLELENAQLLVVIIAALQGRIEEEGGVTRETPIKDLRAEEEAVSLDVKLPASPPQGCRKQKALRIWSL